MSTDESTVRGLLLELSEAIKSKADQLSQKNEARESHDTRAGGKLSLCTCSYYAQSVKLFIHRSDEEG